MSTKRLVLIAVLILVFLAMSMGCAPSRSSFPEDRVQRGLAGEWGNCEYKYVEESPTRRVIDRAGSVVFFDTSYHDSSKETGTITITKAWKGSDGLLWFTDEVYNADSHTTVYELSKLDLRTMYWRLLWSNEEYPPKWDAAQYPSLSYVR